LRGYKFHRRDDLEPFFAQALIEAARKRPWLERVEAVVPVPTHWRRRLRRPSYPAESLARQLSTATNRPLLNLLKRIRAGPHQVGLSLTARLANVRGAFALRNGVALKNSRLLLIDDVRTSGATLEECARVLKRGGAAEVYGAILVRAGDTGLGSPILTSI
jgi:ComF family protein